MALKVEYTDSFGSVHKDAYHKVVETNMFWLDHDAHCVVNIYVDEQARRDGKEPVGQRTYDFPYVVVLKEGEEGINETKTYTFEDVFGDLDDEGANPVSSMYDFLKQLDEYKDAEDV